MRYLVSRDGQTYGPYSLEELHRYVASGHVLLTDNARPDSGEEATALGWTPVAQLLGIASAPPGASGQGMPGPTSSLSGGSPAATYSTPREAFPPSYPQSSSPMGGPPILRATPAPPNLHWGLVLLFDLLTCSLFQMIWNIVLASWFRRIYPATKVVWLYIASAVLLLIQGGMGQAAGFMAGSGRGLHSYYRHGSGILSYGFVALVCWGVRLASRFIFRSELEQYFNSVEPIGLRIDPALTFFFGGIYLQSVMNRINETRRFAAYGMPPR